MIEKNTMQLELEIMIAQGDKWEELVPQAVSEHIKKINGINRIKIISKTDTKPQEF